ncbi:thioredoxin domain-containing protein [Galbibacter sp. EGI 63066]|uniref:thioredoxin domain-containing protein n=1 Tax=Galbibacter sp. EGI 63066 TaxID=2993559 RepID=UPI0022492719|nr:thioredoxin domain-containing protein [Galbibacter sp. EGI 63066]MCX2681516.1 thioredoxin domain-containing protein [Galbibacter sp. EGI 63066]
MTRRFQAIIFILIWTLNSCTGQENKNKDSEMDEEHAYTNNLIHESSPYLLQHAHNPVNWYPWGEEALQKAKDENKLLIISIGYAACHWCHVMEHESFEDEEVAKLMNEHFISIKVDREERPDVDQVYMNAANLLTGRGGWPLNALALPDGKPFYAGTYFPKNDWLKVLNYFVDLKEKDFASIKEQAEKVTQGINSLDNVPLRDDEITFSIEDVDAAFKNMKSRIDFKKGGKVGAPKFPMPSIWEYLLQYSYLSDNEKALEAVTTTLDNMAFGGIYDHVGGGFARYSTDAKWHVPHFEKMLYDNAQLVSLYSKAYQRTKDSLYKKTVYETLKFIEREMTSPKGGFYSSLDADSEGEEGKFYVWTKAEIEAELGDDAPLFIDYYNVKESGNWEHGKNILFRKETDKEFASKNDISVEELQKNISEGKSKLLEARSERVRPGLDDKILTSWNALMLKGYVHAYRAFDDDKFLDSALKNANFLLKNAIAEDGELTRNHKDGKSSIQAMMDDYAFVISAFLDLYQATFDEKWLEKADVLTTYSIEHFFDESSGMFFYTHDDHSNLISRKMEIPDNVIPASNSEMAKNLLFLGNYLYNVDYYKKAKQMLNNVQDDVRQSPNFYSNWGMVEAHFIHPPYEVAVLGDDYENVRKELDRNYLPQVLLLGGKNEGNLELLENKLVEDQTTIYVCQDKICKLPVTEVSKALELMEIK